MNKQIIFIDMNEPSLSAFDFYSLFIDVWNETLILFPEFYVHNSSISSWIIATYCESHYANESSIDFWLFQKLVNGNLLKVIERQAGWRNDQLKKALDDESCETNNLRGALIKKSMKNHFDFLSLLCRKIEYIFRPNSIQVHDMKFFFQFVQVCDVCWHI